jgi:hypothetical protein
VDGTQRCAEPRALLADPARWVIERASRSCRWEPQRLSAVTPGHVGGASNAVVRCGCGMRLRAEPLRSSAVAGLVLVPPNRLSRRNCPLREGLPSATASNGTRRCFSGSSGSTGPGARRVGLANVMDMGV